MRLTTPIRFGTAALAAAAACVSPCAAPSGADTGPTGPTPHTLLKQAVSMLAVADGHPTRYYPQLFGHRTVYEVWLGRDEDQIWTRCPASGGDKLPWQIYEGPKFVTTFPCDAQEYDGTGPGHTVPRRLPAAQVSGRMLALETALGKRMATAAQVSPQDLGSLRNVDARPEKTTATFNPPSAPAAGSHGVQQIVFSQPAGKPLSVTVTVYR